MLAKFRLAILTLASTLALTFALPALRASAVDCSSGSLTAKEALLCGSSGQSSGSVPSTDQGTNSFNHLVSDLLNILSVLSGIVAVTMIIMGGFRFITSGGNPEKVKSARSALMYAII